MGGEFGGFMSFMLGASMSQKDSASHLAIAIAMAFDKDIPDVCDGSC